MPAFSNGAGSDRGSLDFREDLIPPAASPVLTIGVQEGSEDQVIGWIRDLAPVPERGVVVLDRLAFEVMWFGPAGSLKGRSGGRGKGPMEFQEPSDVAVTKQGEILVVDGPLMKIAVFSLGENGMELERTIPLSKWGEQVCPSGSDFILLRYDMGQTAELHLLDARGRFLRSFGEAVLEIPPEQQHLGLDDYYRRLQNSGPLWCDPGGGTVALLHGGIPLLRAFDKDGTEQWRRRFSDLSAVYVTPLGEGKQSVGPDPKTGRVDEGKSVFPWGPDTLAVSFETRDYRARAYRYQLRLVSAVTGEEFERFSVPMVVAGVDSNRIYGYVNDPFPMVLVYER